MTLQSGQELKTALEEFAAARGGGTTESLREYIQELRQVRNRIINALKTGPLTAPEIADRTGLARNVVHWHLATMSKYGQVREADSNGNGPRCMLVK